MSNCFAERWRVFFLAHLLTHPVCTCAEVLLFVFVASKLAALWRADGVSRGLPATALGYFVCSIVHQISGVFVYILTPAGNLARRAGTGYCQAQTLFSWSSITLSYPFLVFFWVERLRQTFKGSTFAVKSKIIARIQWIWFSSAFVGLLLTVGVTVEEKCSVGSRVLDYNPFPHKLHFCMFSKRGKLFAALYSLVAAFEILLTQGILGYMYIWRLKAVFVDSGERVVVGMKGDKTRLRNRNRMTEAELDYFRKSAIIALTSLVTTFVSAILFAVANTYYLEYWDLLLNGLLITCSFKFGATIYKYLFCCCHRVCVATVDRVTSVDEVIRDTPVLSSVASGSRSKR